MAGGMKAREVLTLTTNRGILVIISIVFLTLGRC